ncbi:hypothetical protein, partial [Mesorhizobium sp. M4B.F.Ca.ET.150.01.1.1]|uniref:hypothetical protein n=1 Tax=Mesorhizobium sp. M4B.F.Ca.ET.150.01.1.1 TaxID=2563948 RepID=UPI001AEDD0C7
NQKVRPGKDARRELLAIDILIRSRTAPPSSIVSVLPFLRSQIRGCCAGRAELRLAGRGRTDELFAPPEKLPPSMLADRAVLKRWLKPQTSSSRSFSSRNQRPLARRDHSI